MKDNKKDKTKTDYLTQGSLSFVIILIIVSLAVSLYEKFFPADGVTSGLFRNPEIIATAAGLVISVIFIDRWRSLETKVDKLSVDQWEKLAEIREYIQAQTKLDLGQFVDKAEKLNADIIRLTEQHPWLEVITERDIIVETDSIRGILRTCNMLAQDGKFRHLYEYLEFCLKRGTEWDPREPGKRTDLAGTADDFFEISEFCEIWLQDFDLSRKFIKKYIDINKTSGYALLPEYIRLLLRTGNLPRAKDESNKLRKMVYGGNIFARWMRAFGLGQSMPERYRWRAANVLALTSAVLGDKARVAAYRKDASDNKFSRLLALKQKLFDIEIQVEQGEFDAAKGAIKKLPDDRLGSSELNELVFLLAKLDEIDMASEIRDRLEACRSGISGDDDRVLRRSFSDQNGAKNPFASGEEFYGAVRDACPEAFPRDSKNNSKTYPPTYPETDSERHPPL